MAVIIKEIKTFAGLKKFVDFPIKLYHKNPYYVPVLRLDDLNTLNSKKNPAFDHCEVRYWMAYKEGRAVGRVAAILNHKHVEKWNQAYMRFGWLEFIEDLEVSQALLGAVENWARECQMTAVIGPIGFTDMDREGMLIEGFTEVATLATNYNYPYYPIHLEAIGYKKDTDWIEYELTAPSEPDAKLSRAAEIVLKRNNLTLLKVKNKKELLSYAKDLFDLLNQEYSHLYGTVPLTDEQINIYVNQYFGFIHPDFVPIVLDSDKKMVAFGITIPSLSSALQKSRGRLLPLGWWHLLSAMRKNDRADLYLVAVKKEYQGLGVNMVMMDQISKVFIRRGISKVESNPELETNLNVQSQWKLFEQRQHKRRRCYIKTF
ncbi:MAG: N-acetyltransferase [Anaerolineaceae bacterium]|nr:N-acetyltransferase [Anaerolineaceae bacterium]